MTEIHERMMRVVWGVGWYAAAWLVVAWLWALGGNTPGAAMAWAAGLCVAHAVWGWAATRRRRLVTRAW